MAELGMAGIAYYAIKLGQEKKGYNLKEYV